MENTLRFNVEGMTCGGCVRSVRQALESVPGVTVEHVAVGEPVEICVTDAQADRDAVASAVKQAGYHPIFAD